jgi:hypothetical protein
MNLLSLARGSAAARENPNVPLDPVTTISPDFERTFRAAWEAGTDPACRHTYGDDVFERAFREAMENG